MAKNVLFLVHGVGQQPSDWALKAGGPLEALQDASQAYGHFKGRRLTDLFDVVPIRYDDVFDRILQGWSKLGKSLKAGVLGLDGPFESVSELLEKAGDDKNKLLTFGGDVPLYRGFPLFAQRIQLGVAVQLMEAIEARYRAPADGPPAQFVVVGHSLGTTVVHDALQRLGTERWIDETMKGWTDDAKEEAQAYHGKRKALADRFKTSNPFGPGFVKFKAVYMLSNTSGFLAATCPPDQSLVCPLPRAGQPAYLQSFVNVDHAFDPISKVLPFKLPAAWTGKGGRQIDLDHFHEFNIHAFTHYLRHPAVNLSLLSDLVDDFEPGDPEEVVAAAFTRFGGTLKDLADEKRRLLEERVRRIAEVAVAPALAELQRCLAAYEALKELENGV